MKKFNDERIEEFKFVINDEEFWLTKINPINKTNTMVFFFPGLNFNSNFIKYYANEAFDNVYLFSCDGRAQAQSKLRPSRWYKKYLKDFNSVIDEILKQNKEIKKIYLIGESWGANLAFLYEKYYPNKVNGVLGWNMPYEVIDTSEKTKDSINLKIKVVITFLTGLNTQEKTQFSENSTNNKAMKRLIINSKRLYLSNKVIIAAWRSFKKSWNFLLNNPNKNFLYIQSGEDILMSRKKFKKSQKYKNVIFWEKGTHLLTFDINESDKLFSEIKKFIEK